MLKRILVSLVAIVVLAAVVGLFLPAKTHVERSIAIAAPPARVFAEVNSFKEFNAWSPWYELDPGAAYALEGPASGVGAKTSWKSEKLGSGSQTITASEPDSRVVVALDFGEMGRSTATYTIVPDGAGSKLTWGFDTEHGWNLMERYMGFFLFDGWIGSDYEKGLKKLKAKIESAPAAG